TRPRPPSIAHVCDDIACRLVGAEQTCADLERALGPAGSPARDGQVSWLRSPCLGLCERAPAAMFTIAGEESVRATSAPVDAAGIIARLEAAAAGRTAPGGARPSIPPSNGAEPDAGSLGAFRAAARASVPQMGEPQ